MSLICLIMAFFIDINGGDGSAYLTASLFFAFVDCAVIFVVIGLLYD